MTDWPIKTLGEVCDLISRGRPPAYCEEGGALVLNQKCVRNGKIHLEPARRTDDGEKPIPGWAYLRAGDTLINSTGAGTLGRASFVSQLDEPTTFDTHLTVVRPLTNICWPAYVGLVLNSRESDIVDLAGGATGQTELPREAVRGFEIPVPPLEEQKRIVALLDTATERITELTACYEKARIHANNLFASALREALESNPDWPIKTLGQVATFHNGRAYKQQELLDKGKYRVLRVGNFFSSKSWYWSDLELDEHKYCDKGDLLYAWSASFGPRIWDEEKVIYHYHIWKVVEESQQINRQFLKYWLEEDVERVKSASGTGTTMMHVSKGNIEARLISLPPLEEQKKIVARLDEMKAKTSEMVAAYNEKLNAAKNLRQSILEAAFARDL